MKKEHQFLVKEGIALRPNIGLPAMTTPQTPSPFGAPWENLTGPDGGDASDPGSNNSLVMANFNNSIAVAGILDNDAIYSTTLTSTPGILYNESAWDSFWRSDAATEPDWQLVDQATSTRSLSLAVFGDTLYLSYLGVGNNQVNIYGIDGENTGVYYQIPGVSAQYATVVTEEVSDEEQLAVYYVDASDSTLWRISTPSPETVPTSHNNSWVSNNINYQSGTTASPSYSSQTASGPLAVASAGGITTIAYQGGTLDHNGQSDTIYISTSAGGQFSPYFWNVNAYTNPNQRTQIGLGNP